MRAFLVVLAFGLALFCVSKARADAVFVVANTAPAYPGDYRLVAVGSVAPTDLVIVCPSATPGRVDMAKCGSARVRVPASTVKPTDMIGYCYGGTPGAAVLTCDVANGGGEGWQLASAASLGGDVPTPAVTPPPPCWPLKGNFKTFPIPAAVTARFDRIVLWACDTPTGYYTHSMMFAWANVLPFTGEYPITKARGDELYAANAKALTADEAAYGDLIRNQYLPTCAVAVNGTSATRPRYVKNTDGTRGAQSGTAPVGAACLAYRRVPGTTYYELKDAPGFVAVGTVTLPLGVN